MINGKQELKVGQHFRINGKQMLLDKIENGTAVIINGNKRWVYGLEMFRRTLQQIGYELVEEDKND